MKLIEKWQARHAQKLLDQAKREVTDPRPRTTIRVILAWILSILVIATPFAVMAGGALLIVSKFFSVPATIIGLILIGFGYVLLPPRHLNSKKTYRRDDLPRLFDLLDKIASRLGTRAPDGIHLDDELNAYMAQFRAPFARREEWILGIGFALWTAASPAQRVALLAHELAHKVNNDPMRKSVHARAHSVLENWYETFAIEGDHGFIGNLVQFVGRSLVGALLTILLRLSHFESQRAEYRADAHAARITGADASISLLEILTRADLARRSLVDLYPYRQNQNGRIFDHMGAALADAEPHVIDRYLAEAAAEQRRVDGSHPPTTMRIEFLRSLPQAAVGRTLDGAELNFAEIDAELEPIKHALGRQMMQELYDTEVNR